MAGLLLSKNSQQLTFIHKSFQEYLAAWKLVSFEEEDIADIFYKKIEDVNWREILIFSIAILQKQGTGRVLRLYNRIINADNNDGANTDKLLSMMQIVSELDPKSVHPIISDSIISSKQNTLSFIKDPTVPTKKRVLSAITLGWANIDPRVGWIDDEHTVLVPAGEFSMGRHDTLAYPHEQSGKMVHLGDYRITRNLVTCVQFKEFINCYEFQNANHWRDGKIYSRDSVKSYDFDLRRRSNFPITYVNWYEAAAFCSWLNVKYLRRDGWKWRLPNEYEWEKAGRGGFTIGNGKMNEDKIAFIPGVILQMM